MNSTGFDDSSISRLEGSSDTGGGLILRKSSDKSNSTTAEKVSLLGLQKLAQEKRRNRKDEVEMSTSKKPRLNDWEDDDNGKQRTNSGKSRHYRTQMADTPSHPGGVSEEYKEKKRRRDERERALRKGGVYAETRKREKESSRGNKRDKYSDESRRSKRDKDHGSSTNRRDSSREYHSTRGHYNWDETPSTRRREDREYTPSRNSRGWCSCL